MLRNWLAVILAAIFLAACGGGDIDEAPTSSPTAQAEVPKWDLSKAVSAGRLLSGAAVPERRMRALAATDTTCAVTADELFNWAETLKLPVFYKGPKTLRGPYLGVTYDYRFYPGAGIGNYIGVVVSGGPVGAVFVMGNFTDGELVQYASLPDYVRDVKGDCGGTGKAGVLDMSMSGQRLAPDLVDGKLTYVGAADEQIYKPALAEIRKVCWYSHRSGGWYNAKDNPNPAGCVTPRTDGTLAFANMCNNDRGQVAVWANNELWPDFKNARGWKFAGDLNPKLAGDFIEYGNYQPSKVSYRKDGGVLRGDFGSDCMRGFNQPLAPGDLQFRWESDRDGWENDAKKRTHLQWDPVGKKFFFELGGLSCGQRGIVTVYKPKTMNGKDVATWQDKPFTSISIPREGVENPLWERDDSVRWFFQRRIDREEWAITLNC